MAMWNTIKIGWKADLAIACVDSVTGKIIRDAALQVWAPGYSRPVRKADGYYVFLGCGKGSLPVRIRSPFFQEVLLEQKISLSVGELPVCWVRLLPNKCYPFPEETVFLEGVSTPGSHIAVTAGQPIRLGEDYKKGGDTICFRLPEDIRLDGALFELSVKGQKAVEEVRIGELLDDGRYRLNMPLKKDYMMAHTTVFPIWETVSEEDGRFWMALPKAAGSVARCRWQRPNSKHRMEQECVLESAVTKLELF